MRADTIYKNRRFYTENRTVPWAEAVAIEGRNLIAVGTESDCTAFADEKTRIIDLGGRVVLPGLIDGHTHPITVARTHRRIQIPLTHDLEELLANLIVLNKNIFETPAEEIAGVDAQLVIYEGKERIVTSNLGQ